MSRIESSKINVGNSVVVKADEYEGLSDVERQLRMLSPEKRKEFLDKSNIIILEAQSRAQKILSDAQGALEQAKKDAESIRVNAQEDGYKQGYDDGYKKGYSDGNDEAITLIRNEVTDKLDALNDFISSYLDIKKEIVKALNIELAELISAFVEQLCLKNSAENVDIIAKMLQVAVSKLKEKEDITLIVHPDMKQKVESLFEYIRRESPLVSNIKLTEDINLEKDGVIVESLDTRIDATFSSYVKEIIEQICQKSYSFSKEELEEEYKEHFNTPENSENLQKLSDGVNVIFPETHTEEGLGDSENVDV